MTAAQREGSLGFWRRPAGGAPHVVGHRGARGDAPENTLAAFAKAAAVGAAAVELDVRTCAGGELVVMHDPTLARLTDGRDGRRVAELPFAELSRVRLRGGERVPRLADVLELLRAGGTGVNVEMKHDAPDRGAVVRATAAVLAAADPCTPVLVSSFDPRMLAAFAKRAPAIPRALIIHRSRYHPAMLALAHAAARAARPFIDAVHIERTLAAPARIEALRKQGLIVSVWTVNDRSEAARLAAMGVDSLISDEPGALL